MAKFGELITQNTPVFITFYSEFRNDTLVTEKIIVPLKEEFKEVVKFIKIDIDKNPDLCDALRINGHPTIMIYNDGQMLYRKQGEIEINEIKVYLYQLQCKSTNP